MCVCMPGFRDTPIEKHKVQLYIEKHILCVQKHILYGEAYSIEKLILQ